MPKTHVDKKLGSSSKQGRHIKKEQTHLRNNRTIKRLNMYKNKIKRDPKTGEIIKGSVLREFDTIPKGSMARIAPDRRWFGNTRVIGQQVLEKFREELKAKFHDPYSVVIKPSKLPLTLLEMKDHDENSIKMKLDWQGTYGDKKTRRRPKLAHFDYAAMLAAAEQKSDQYEAKNNDQQTEQAHSTKALEPVDRTLESVFKKGQSNRIWNELYKVIDSSDVILQVLDARDPMGTRSRALENYLRKEKKYKHLVFVLNKCDLVPTWATSRWVALLSREYPTVAFHASITNPFGKGNLIQLIRQFGKLHKANNSDFLSIGLVGYPNVGKSSVINTLRKQKVCNVAPIPGETKVWQYVKLSKTIFLIDCPGVIHQNDDPNDTHQAVLKGVVRVERISHEDKSDFVETILKLVDRKKIEDTYGVTNWKDHLEFLDMLAEKRGKLIKGGVPNRDSVATTVLYDWQRAKIPWFVPPPFESEAEEAAHRTLPKAEHMKAIDNLVSTKLYDPEQDRERNAKRKKQATEMDDGVAADEDYNEDADFEALFGDDHHFTDPAEREGDGDGESKKKKRKKSTSSKKPIENADVKWDDLETFL